MTTTDPKDQKELWAGIEITIRKLQGRYSTKLYQNNFQAFIILTFPTQSPSQIKKALALIKPARISYHLLKNQDNPFAGRFHRNKSSIQLSLLHGIKLIHLLSTNGWITEDKASKARSDINNASTKQNKPNEVARRIQVRCRLARI